VEFVPFKAQCQRIAGIMSGCFFSDHRRHTRPPRHTFVEGPDRSPARDLHFDGLVATTLSRWARSARVVSPRHGQPHARCNRADLLLFNAGYKLHQDSIQQVVADVAAARFNGAARPAVRRALAAKARFGLLQPVRRTCAAAGIAGSRAHRALASRRPQRHHVVRDGAKPVASFAASARRTAWSSRAIGIVPRRTSATTC